MTCIPRILNLIYLKFGELWSVASSEVAVPASNLRCFAGKTAEVQHYGVSRDEDHHNIEHRSRGTTNPATKFRIRVGVAFSKIVVVERNIFFNRSISLLHTRIKKR